MNSLGPYIGDIKYSVYLRKHFSWYTHYYVQEHTFWRNQISGTCANPAESIKKSCARICDPSDLKKCRITAQIMGDSGTGAESTFKARTNSTTKDILALLQIFLHIPFKRSMGLVESLFGKCRNGSPA
jgi:hypothetical protein